MTNTYSVPLHTAAAAEAAALPAGLLHRVLPPQGQLRHVQAQRPQLQAGGSNLVQQCSRQSQSGGCGTRELALCLDQQCSLSLPPLCASGSDRLTHCCCRHAPPLSQGELRFVCTAGPDKKLFLSLRSASEELAMVLRHVGARTFGPLQFKGVEELAEPDRQAFFEVRRCCCHCTASGSY